MQISNKGYQLLSTVSGSGPGRGENDRMFEVETKNLSYLGYSTNGRRRSLSVDKAIHIFFNTKETLQLFFKNRRRWWKTTGGRVKYAAGVGEH